MNFADGPVTGRGDNPYSRLYIQEGAIVEIKCKSQNALHQVEASSYWYGIFFLNYDESDSDTTYADFVQFPYYQNWERYQSTVISSSLNGGVKFMSTLRYTARMEDNGKYLHCRTAEWPLSSSLIFPNAPNAALVVLVVRRKYIRVDSTVVLKMLYIHMFNVVDTAFGYGTALIVC